MKTEPGCDLRCVTHDGACHGLNGLLRDLRREIGDIDVGNIGGYGVRAKALAILFNAEDRARRR